MSELIVQECPRNDVRRVFKEAAKDGVVSVTKPQMKPNRWVGAFDRRPGIYEPVGCSLIFQVGVNQWRLAGAWVAPQFRGCGIWRQMLDLRMQMIVAECAGRPDVPVVVDAFVRPSIKDAYVRRGFLVIREFQGSAHVRKVLR